MSWAIVEDLRRYDGPWTKRLCTAALRPGFWAVAAFRAMEAVDALPAPISLAVKLWARPLQLAVQLVTGVELQSGARIGPGLYVAHWGGIVVSRRSTLGARCDLSPGVTLSEAASREGRFGAPTLGDRVFIGPGAKLYGPIRIGSDAAIGANAVVNRDVPEGVTAAGVPARVVSEQGSRGLLEAGQEVRPEAPRNVVRVEALERN